LFARATIPTPTYPKVLHKQIVSEFDNEPKPDDAFTRCRSHTPNQARPASILAAMKAPQRGLLEHRRMQNSKLDLIGRSAWFLNSPNLAHRPKYSHNINRIVQTAQPSVYPAKSTLTFEKG
jgi:hypothetical protein